MSPDLEERDLQLRSKTSNRLQLQLFFMQVMRRILLSRRHDEPEEAFARQKKLLLGAFASYLGVASSIGLSLEVAYRRKLCHVVRCNRD